MGAMLGNMANCVAVAGNLEQALQSPSVPMTLEIPPGDSMILREQVWTTVCRREAHYNVRGRGAFRVRRDGERNIQTTYCS